MAGWESCPYVSTDGRARVCGVGACACKVTTSTDLREASGPRVDRIPLARPTTLARRHREINYFFFWAPGVVVSISLDHERTERYSNGCVSHLQQEKGVILGGADRTQLTTKFSLPHGAAAALGHP